MFYDHLLNCLKLLSEYCCEVPSSNFGTKIAVMWDMISHFVGKEDKIGSQQ